MTTDKSKPVKQEVNGTVIRPPLGFPVKSMIRLPPGGDPRSGRVGVHHEARPLESQSGTSSTGLEANHGFLTEGEGSVQLTSFYQLAQMNYF
jgi:hypothetical protein